MTRAAILALLSASALLAPTMAAAQGYYYPGDRPSSAGPEGDYYGARRAFAGYPEFRGIEQHIRAEIQEGVRDDLIERDDARDLFGQLREVQRQEAREFGVHGWNLPDDDRERIRARLDELDRLVDQVRAEPED